MNCESCDYRPATHIHIFIYEVDEELYDLEYVLWCDKCAPETASENTLLFARQKWGHWTRSVPIPSEEATKMLSDVVASRMLHP